MQVAPKACKALCLLVGSAFAFLQMNPFRDCHLQTQQTVRMHTKSFANACYLRLNNVSHMVVTRTTCHVGTMSTRPFIAPSSEPQWGLILTELLHPNFLGLNRRSRSDGKKLSIPSTSCTQAARCGAPSINLPAGLESLLTCAPFQQTPSPRLATCKEWGTQDLGLQVSRSGFYLPRVYTPRQVGSQFLDSQFPHFLHAPTQSSKDLENSTNGCNPQAGKAIAGPKELSPYICAASPFQDPQ